MRDFKGMKRQRGRNRGGGGVGKPQQHNANRAFDSNGPEGIKVRGAAQGVFEKYQQLARDATSGGDRVLAENYLQHAEHYFRVLRAMQPHRPISDIVGREQYSSNFDIDFEADPGPPPAEVIAPATEEGAETREEQPYSQGQNGQRREYQNDRPREDRPRDDRPRDDRPRDDRPREDRPRWRDDRPRDDRPRDDRPRDDKPREERPRDDRPRDDRPREERFRERDERRRERLERQETIAADPLAVIEPRGAVVEERGGDLRGHGGETSEAPAFLRRETRAAPAPAPEIAGETASEETPKPRRRRTKAVEE